MEAGEYGQTRVTCSVARLFEVVAVAGLLWIPWCVLGGADFPGFFSFFIFSLNAHGLLQSIRRPCLIYLPTSSIDILVIV